MWDADIPFRTACIFEWGSEKSKRILTSFGLSQARFDVSLIQEQFGIRIGLIPNCASQL